LSGREKRECGGNGHRNVMLAHERCRFSADAQAGQDQACTKRRAWISSVGVSAQRRRARLRRAPRKQSLRSAEKQLWQAVFEGQIDH
jgi:hypothetical protein